MLLKDKTTTDVVAFRPPQPASLRETLALIREDYSMYQDWSKPGFRATLLHRLARWRLGLPRPIRLPLWWAYKSAHRYIRNHYGIDLEYTVDFGRRIVLANQGNIAIHPHSVIGDDCILRQNVTLGAARGGNDFNAAPMLGNNVELGAGVVVVGRVLIGDGCRVGPNVTVFRNIPANSLVMPAEPRIIPRMNLQVSVTESKGEMS